MRQVSFGLRYTGEHFREERMSELDVGQLKKSKIADFKVKVAFSCQFWKGNSPMAGTGSSRDFQVRTL